VAWWMAIRIGHAMPEMRGCGIADARATT